MKQRIFVSYTLRDNQITIDLLSRLKEAAKLREIDTFIDIIDNNSSSEDHQKILYEWLTEADCLYLIETAETYHSPWVKKELDLANKFNIPITKVSLQDVEQFITDPHTISLRSDIGILHTRT